MRNAPKWMLETWDITQRQWKQEKRKQLRALKKALRSLNFGCVYTPMDMGAIHIIKEKIAELEKSLSLKNWGR